MGLSGYSEGATLMASTIEQMTDWGEGDSRFDREPMLAGWRLAGVVGNNPSGRSITRQDVITILNNHPHWEVKTRYAITHAPVPNQPSTLDQINDEWQRFNNMSPLDQAKIMRRLFGG